MPASLESVDRGYRLQPCGLVVTRVLSFEEWAHVGRCLMEVLNRTNWAIGDWLIYGDGRGDYGETYVEAARITGRSFESLSQSARVSREFPIERRTWAVVWSLYREALRMPEADRGEALALATEQRWTRDQFTDYLLRARDRDVEIRPDIALVIADEERTRALPRVTPQRELSWTPVKKSHHLSIRCPHCGRVFEPKASA